MNEVIEHMGLDIYIDKCRNPKIVDGKREYTERAEVCYWRGFYDLLQQGLPFVYGNDEYGQDVHLSKKDVEHILNYVVRHRDHFDSFQGVEQVCELLDQYDDLTKEEGYVICFNAG